MKATIFFRESKCFLLSFVFLLSFFQFANSQDKIVKRSGEEILAKVKEVGLTEIVYKKWENQGGPDYRILKQEVSFIRYENGSEDAFSVPDQVPATENDSPLKADPVSVPFRPHFESGFNLLMHNGMYGSTVPARPDGGAYTPAGGDQYYGLGFGVNIDFRLMEWMSIHFDINNYTSTTPLAYKMGYATSDWVWEMNDYGSRLIGPFSENANYNINTTGMRLGLKFYPLKGKKIDPWIGLYYGYYVVNLGVFSEDKKSTYGNTSEEVTSPTYFNFGFDWWTPDKSFGATIFAEFGSPVIANYSIENCLHTGWTFQDYGEGMHIFGYNRFGVSISFSPASKNK